MENKPVTKTRLSSILKTLVLLLLGSVLIVCTAVALRSLCASKIITAKATTDEYIQLSTDTPLYKNNDLTHEIITLPSGYFAKVLSTTNKLSRVEYNGIIGYINNTNGKSASPKGGTVYQTATLYTRSDAGTHLRATPSATSERIFLIPAGSTLTYIGETTGDIPSDGTSPVWYYVHFDAGDTTTHTGYVYSERTIITNISAKPEVSTITENTVATTTTTTTPEQETEIPESLGTPLSSGLKIFLVILFSILAVIIFALLLISPKGAKNNKKTTIEYKPAPPTAPVKNNSIPAYNQPEFGNFVEFTQPENKHKKSKSFIAPRKSNSHHGIIKLANPPKNTIDNTTLPPSIAKYFKTERVEPDDLDDELL